MLLTTCCCIAQTPEELLNKYVTNISIPDEKIETMCFNLSLSSDNSIYPMQVWYKNNGRLGLNLFDTDKTPLLIIRNDKVVFYDALQKQLTLFPNCISVLKVIYENSQFNANAYFHLPNAEEKENTIKIDFLSLAQTALKNLQAKQDGEVLTLTGSTEINSIVTSMVDPRLSFPLKSFSINTGDSLILFDKIATNVEIDDNNEIFIYPDETLKSSKLKIVEIDPNTLLGTVQLMQTVVQGTMIRMAIYDESMREGLEKAVNQKIDWADLKASDTINSAKLRTIFRKK